MGSLVKEAFELAKKAHKGQFRNDKKTPYIDHPVAVAHYFNNDDSGDKYFLQAIALLHDVIEDTPVTINDLRDKGFPKKVIMAVDLLTHRKGQRYLDYILAIKINPLAIKVKIADIEHNMLTSSGNQKGKYELALYILSREAI